VLDDTWACGTNDVDGEGGERPQPFAARIVATP
jgi:hypothetical protein